MLAVANGPILAEKSPKNPYYGKIPKKWKNPTQKKIYFFNQVKYVFPGYETRWTQWLRNFSLLKLRVAFRISQFEKKIAYVHFDTSRLGLNKFQYQ
jgi:hypothetical protein